MKSTIIILIIVLAVGIYGVYTVIGITATQDNATNPSIVQTPMTIGSGNKVITYVAAGDSTAVGQGASSVQNTYTYQIAQHIEGMGDSVQYTDIAVGGAKTQDVIDNQVPQIIAANPDIVTISIGANDVTHLRTNDSIVQNDITIISDLLEQTNAQIYIANIPNFYNATLLPSWYRSLLEYKIKSLNPKIQALAQNRVHIIDIHSIPTTISSDKFHPDDSGYQSWANAFIAALQANGQ
jgi:acyl-CoA thioesterase-1